MISNGTSCFLLDCPSLSHWGQLPQAAPSQWLSMMQHGHRSFPERCRTPPVGDFDSGLPIRAAVQGSSYPVPSLPPFSQESDLTLHLKALPACSCSLPFPPTNSYMFNLVTMSASQRTQASTYTVENEWLLTQTWIKVLFCHLLTIWLAFNLSLFSSAIKIFLIPKVIVSIKWVNIWGVPMMCLLYLVHNWFLPQIVT